MNESTTYARGSLQPDTPTPSAVPPSQHHPRRPRVREVSSRFMSPVTSSFSGDLHSLADKSPLPKNTASSPDLRARQQQSRANCAQRRFHQDLEPLCSADVNRPDIVRSMENPFGSHTMAPVPRRQRVVKLFKENEEREEQHHPDAFCPDTSKLSRKNGGTRIDTPMVGSTNRLPPAKLRLQRSADSGMISAAMSATKLLQSSGLSQCPNEGSDKGSMQTVSRDPASSDSNQGSSCPSSPIPAQKCRTRPRSHLRSSSLPESDMLLTVSSSFSGERNGCGVSTSCRSLNLPLSDSEQSLNHSASMLSKPHANSFKTRDTSLPPQPVGTKPASDTRKGKKGTSHQEEVHCLKMLYNRYLQWRFANAKAENSMNAQRREAEGTLYSASLKLSELNDLVGRKRIELRMLQRLKNLYTIIEAQMPYLEDWSALEGDYQSSLSEVIQALVNASIQLPIGGHIKADLREIEDAISSALNVVEMIRFQTQCLMPKALEMDRLSSQLARYSNQERVLVKDCEDLLSKTYSSQVEECSLRGQMMQLHRNRG